VERTGNLDFGYIYIGGYPEVSTFGFFNPEKLKRIRSPFPYETEKGICIDHDQVIWDRSWDPQLAKDVWHIKQGWKE